MNGCGPFLAFPERWISSSYDMRGPYFPVSCHISPPFPIHMLQDDATCKPPGVSTIPAEDARFIDGRIREAR